MHGSFDISEARKSRWAITATGLAVGVALTLIVGKFIAWQFSGSTALLGSLADSALDLLGSIVAFVGVRWAAEPADQDHRFGHHKAEAIASLLQVVLIAVSAIYISIESITRFLEPVSLNNGPLAMGVMLGSMILSAGLVAFQTLAYHKSGSLAVRGDRAHYASDLIANTGTLLALFLVYQFGVLRADAVAGFLAAAFLLHAAWGVGRQAVPQLMDQEAGEDIRQEIMSIVGTDPEVVGIHALRTRVAGRRLYIQMHVEMDPEITLEHAHEISDRVESALLKHFPGADILLHQDPAGKAEHHDAFGRRDVAE
jgi:ferrous-iron efflux pump FieF